MSSPSTRPAVAGPGPRVLVLVLTTFDLDDVVYEALRAGATARGAADQSDPGRRGRRIDVRAVRDPAADRGSPASRAGQRPRLGALTERETEVLVYVARRPSNAETARALFVRENTVNTHAARLLTKLGLRARV